MTLSFFSAVKFQVEAESPIPDEAKTTEEIETQSLSPSPVKLSKPTRSNVAVITVYDKELDEEGTAHRNKRRKKSSAKKKKSSLTVQVRR